MYNDDSNCKIFRPDGKLPISNYHSSNQKELINNIPNNNIADAMYFQWFTQSDLSIQYYELIFNAIKDYEQFTTKQHNEK
jgi:hypothetical protein